jgi:hypothetical protein
VHPAAEFLKFIATLNTQIGVPGPRLLPHSPSHPRPPSSASHLISRSELFHPTLYTSATAHPHRSDQAWHRSDQAKPAVRHLLTPFQPLRGIGAQTWAPALGPRPIPLQDPRVNPLPTRARDLGLDLVEDKAGVGAAETKAVGHAAHHLLLLGGGLHALG